ncbi:hypothetical protein [Flavobacterium sp. LB1P71]|uniref:hypothetical protein n=1 Tax=Flavobacterium sp. LB1P71 TaxID=3401716 RepID=UPI003AAFC3C8
MINFIKPLRVLSPFHSVHVVIVFPNNTLPMLIMTRRIIFRWKCPFKVWTKRHSSFEKTTNEFNVEYR